MRVVILAGGKGTRFAEETTEKPKPMVEIGGKPILWHIMSIYASYGFKDFIIALGYKGEIIKDFFLRYHTENSDISIDLASEEIVFHKSHGIDWNVRMID